MTINIANNNPRINYTATANQTVFTVPFEFFDNTDIKVYIEGTLKTITTHYTVSGGNGSTGSVTLTAGATLNDEVTLVRDVPLERTTDLTSSYNAASIDAQLDRIVAEIADLDDRVSRTIQINDYELASGLLLPALDSRKGKTIQFNTSSGALEVGPTGADLTAIGSVTSEIATLAGISGNITTVAGSNAAITAVSNSITSVNAINTALTNVNRVGNAIVIVDLVGTSISDVNDVADSLGEISAVQAKLTNIDTVAIASTNIGTVAGSISQVNSVASKIADVTGVNNNISAITTANANSTNINLVANNIDDVNDVGTVITKVTTVADNIANVNLVAPNAQYLSDVANNITAINAIAPLASDLTNVTDNLTAIQNAGTNATNAASSATSAATSATAAQTAKTAAETALDEFTDIYLGSKSVAPTVDNDGNALATGSIYWNSGVDQLYIWDGSAWDDAAFTASGAVTSFNTRTGAVTLSSADVTNAAGLLTTGGTMTGALNVESTITADGLTVDGNNNIQINRDGVSSAKVFWNRGATQDAAIELNASEDLSISVDDAGLGGKHLNLINNNKLGFRLTSGGDISFYEDTGTTAKFFWDSSAESLGIGTSSPAIFGVLAVKKDQTADTAISVSNAGTASASTTMSFALTESGTTQGWLRRYRDGTGNTEVGFSDALLFSGNVTGSKTERMRIDSSGRVMIGTITEGLSDGDDLTVSGSGSVGITIRSTSSGQNNLYFSDATSGAGEYAGYVTYEHNVNAMRLGINGTERLRIDSSGNVGIGTTSTLAKMTVIDTTDATKQIVFGNNATYYGSIGHDAGTGSNSYITETAGNHKFMMGTTERMRIDNSGNVGIGTSSPATGLHLYNKNITIEASSGTGNSWTYYKNPDKTYLVGLRGSSNDALSFYDLTADVERMRIDSSGNVGIGESDPDSTLTVKGASHTNFQVKSNSESTKAFIQTVQDSDVRIGSSTNHPVTLYQNGTERMRIDSSGNVLVGRTTLSGTDNTQGAYIFNEGALVAQRSSNPSLFLNRYGTDGDIALFRKEGTTVGSIGTKSDDLVIHSSVQNHVGLSFGDGNLLPTNYYGTTSNNTVDIGSTSRRFKDLYLSGNCNTSRVFTDKDGDWGMEMRGATTARIRFHTSAGGTGQVGSITVSTSSTTYTTSSDYRLKENVVDLTGASARVNQLNPSRFNFISDADKTVDGFLAHEVADVVPEAITGTKDAMMDEEYEVTPAVLDEDGNVTTEAVMGTRSVPDYQGIDQSKLVPLLTAALQEALTEIASLKTRVEALEG